MAGRTREQMEQRSEERKALAGTLLPPGAAEVDTREGRTVLAKAAVLDELFDMFKPDIAEQLPGMINPGSFIRTVLTGMRTSKQAVQLMLCSRPSLLSALLEAARLGLTPFTDEAALVPFWSNAERQYIATFIPMYKGYITLMHRTGKVAGVAANLIRQKDKWELSYGDDGRFWHEPALVDRTTGESVPQGGEGNMAILAYCYVTFLGGGRTEVTTVTRGQAIEIRDEYSESYKQAEKLGKETGGKRGFDSFWHTDFDKAMRKTAVRQHAGVAPLSPELRELEAIDRRDDTRAEVRARAAEVQAAPMRQGIDWDKTVDGTNPGDVPGPQGGQDDGGQADGGQHQQRDQATVTGGTRAAPPANGQALANTRTRARLRGRFSRADMAGDDHAQFRLVVIGMLVAGQYRKLDDDGQLTQAEAEYAINQFDNLQARAERAGQDLADALRGVYDRAIAERGEALAENRDEAGRPPAMTGRPGPARRRPATPAARTERPSDRRDDPAGDLPGLRGRARPGQHRGRPAGPYDVPAAAADG